MERIKKTRAGEISERETASLGMTSPSYLHRLSRLICNAYVPLAEQPQAVVCKTVYVGANPTRDSISFSAGGASENSPRFQPWVSIRKSQAPKGRLKLIKYSTVPPGLVEYLPQTQR